MTQTGIFTRSSGVLLHPTSLPGRYGIGDLGEWAYRFVDLLQDNQQRLWQVLPLGPTSYGDSPYQCLSAFAGNPLLISLDMLAGEGWLTAHDLEETPPFPDNRVDFGPVITFHYQMLERAYHTFQAAATDELRAEHAAWAAAQSGWLDDFALYFALKTAHEGRPWVEWPQELALHEAAALAEARVAHQQQIASIRWIQWQFFRQWSALKQYANARDVRLVGDVPIFVAHDSADVWGNRAQFFLDDSGQPTVIAGVPPDYFSATGQRWGNPLYRWDIMREDEYAWWVNRIRAILSVVDYVRIDHFRGFEAYWEVPASEETAINGQWVHGPGAHFFRVLKEKLGDLPIIAEDLGVITEGVEALRDGFGLPGMKVLQFAWGDFTGREPFLPHNYVQNCVAYSGTHDNNTTVGWWTEEATPQMKDHIRQYLGCPPAEIHWDLIRLGEASTAQAFIVPLQDMLGLGSEARMNLPGRESGNWFWRCSPSVFSSEVWPRLANLTYIYGRTAAATDPLPEVTAV
jgi:4-alpha-glucanotransferase